jgi:hypothetical protein
VLDAQKASRKTKNRAEKAQGPQEAAPEEVKPVSRTDFTGFLLLADRPRAGFLYTAPATLTQSSLGCRKAL